MSLMFRCEPGVYQLIHQPIRTTVLSWSAWATNPLWASQDMFPRWTSSTPAWSSTLRHQLAHRHLPHAHWLAFSLSTTSWCSGRNGCRNPSTTFHDSGFLFGGQACNWIAGASSALSRRCSLGCTISFFSRPISHSAPPPPPKSLTSLTNHLHALRAMVLRDQHQEAHPSTFGTHEVNKAAFLSKMFALWKVGRRVPDPCLLHPGTHDPLGTPHIESAALSDHLSTMFDVIDLNDQPEVDDFLAFIHPPKWDQLSFYLEEAIEIIRAALPSRGGPDDLEHRIFCECPEELATMAVESYQHACEHASLPGYLLASFTLFIPKPTTAGVFPADLRPITLNSIVTKVVPAILAGKALLDSDTWCHPFQHGCGHGRSTAMR